MNALALTISDIAIRQDADGRFNLNDLHKAAGGGSKHQPANWLRNQQTLDLIEFLKSEESKAGIPAIQSKQQLGTFVAKELVYAYAMWISPAFSLKVIRTFDALVTNRLQEHSLIPPTGPLTLAQFNAAQQAVTAAQKHLLSVQVIISATDLQHLKGKSSKAKKAVAPKRWTPEDSLAAQEMQAKGYGPTHIAKLIGGRTAAGVRNHLRYLAKKAQGGAA